MAAATGRAKPSEPPPAGYGTTQVTVLSGQAAARALPAAPVANRPASAARREMSIM